MSRRSKNYLTLDFSVHFYGLLFLNVFSTNHINNISKGTLLVCCVLTVKLVNIAVEKNSSSKNNEAIKIDGRRINKSVNCFSDFYQHPLSRRQQQIFIHQTFSKYRGKFTKFLFFSQFYKVKFLSITIVVFHLIV